jgi:hypothetical protein
MGLGGRGGLDGLNTALQRSESICILTGSSCLKLLQRNTIVEIIGEVGGVQGLAFIGRTTQTFRETNGLLAQQLTSSSKALSCGSGSLDEALLFLLGGFSRRFLLVWHAATREAA